MIVHDDGIAFENFASSPFPLHRDRGRSGQHFFDVRDGARRGRTTRHGVVCWEDQTYAQSQVLLALPSNFDASRPATLVVYLHGNRARLDRDVMQRQQLPRQVREAAINAVLVAPQFALDAADSSAGRFAVRGVFRAFVDEALQALDALRVRRAGTNAPPSLLAQASVIIVAYSGGYCPAAAALKVGRAAARVRGVVLLDALYDHAALFAGWVTSPPRRAFLVSAYTHSTRPGNVRLRALLEQQHQPYTLGLRAQLAPGSTCLVPLGGAVEHAEVATRAWCIDPVTDILRRAGPSAALDTLR